MKANEREKRDGRGTSERKAETMPAEYHLSFLAAVHPEHQYRRINVD